MEIKAAIFDIKVTCNAHEGFNDESATVHKETLEQLGNTIKEDLLKNGVDDVKIKGYYTEQLKAKHDMKYFEVNDPYYALIKAYTKEKAMELYTKDSADDEGDLANELTEVGEIYAAVRYGRAPGEDRNLVPLKEVLKDITSDEEMVLLTDGDLL